MQTQRAQIQNRGAERNEGTYQQQVRSKHRITHRETPAVRGLDNRACVCTRRCYIHQTVAETHELKKQKNKTKQGNLLLADLETPSANALNGCEEHESHANQNNVSCALKVNSLNNEQQEFFLLYLTIQSMSRGRFEQRGCVDKWQSSGNPCSDPTCARRWPA